MPLPSPSQSSRLLKRSWGLLLLGLLTACSQSGTPKAASPSEVPSPQKPEVAGKVRAPFDVDAVIQQVRFAYRAEGAGWRAGYSTYEVQVGAESLSLTPIHQGAPQGQVVKGTPLTLGPALLTRGEQSLGTGQAQARVEEDGHLALVRGELVEHLRNGEQGVEQSWSFERAPAGQGDVLVRIPVQSLSYRGVTEGGLHFADARTGLGFRYGHATWVERSGRRTGLKAEFDQGHIRLRVPASLLESSEYPAVLDPIISPEMDVDLPVARVEPGAQRTPAIAFNGTLFLVVWEDARLGGTIIYGARVSATGQVLDLAGLRLSTGSDSQARPAVASNGADFFVVWEDLRSSWDIYGARVTGSGQVLSSPEIPISVEPTSQRTPDIAARGADYLVVWSDNRVSASSSDIYGARVSSTGTVLDPAGFVVASAPELQVNPSIASSSPGFFVAWEDTRTSAISADIYGARLSDQGTRLDPLSGVLLSNAANRQFAPDVASNGSDYLVVWQDNRVSSSDPQIYGTRVAAASGTRLDAAGLLISGALGYQSEPSVGFNGADYLVVWADDRAGSHIYGGRVSSAGAVLDGSGLPLTTTENLKSGPVIAFDGTGFLVVWSDLLGTNEDIHGVRLSATGTPLGAEQNLSTATNAQLSPSVASNGANYLVVWHDDRGGTPDIYGARLSLTGEMLDPQGLLLSNAAGSQVSPDVASNGTDYLVVWRDVRTGASQGLSGARVTSAGQVLSIPTPIGGALGSTVRNTPAVASDGTDYFVSWSEVTSTSSDLYGASVTAAGGVGSRVTVCNAPQGQTVPALAFNGTHYLVAWRDARSATSVDIYGNLVSRTGTVSGTSGFVISNASGTEDNPAVAAVGTDFFVVWDDSRNGATNNDIYGARVSGSGTVRDPTGLVISNASDAQLKPAIASSGTDYFVVWHDLRSGQTYDLYGTQVSSAGAATSPSGLNLSANTGGDETDAALTFANPSQLLLTYIYYDHRGVTDRARARLISTNSPPVATPLTTTTPEDTAVAVTLAGTDPENDPLTFTVVTQPANGTLSGTAPNLTYTPAANYNGADSFTFRVSDGSAASAAATVSITVQPVNDAPVAQAQSVTVQEDGSLAIVLTGTDVENSPLTFTVVTQPARGTLSGTAPNLTYTPTANYSGADSFTFRVSDGSATSAVATVSITVQPVNDAPVATPRSVTTNEDTAAAITLTGTDPENSALTFTVVTQPANGTLSGTAPNLTYTPTANYSGPDSFTFR
ncbi:MAG TPA: Ig-like domain-containing protein, partial [Myxococcaceae bacterium]